MGPDSGKYRCGGVVRRGLGLTDRRHERRVVGTADDLKGPVSDLHTEGMLVVITRLAFPRLRDYVNATGSARSCHVNTRSGGASDVMGTSLIPTIAPIISAWPG